MRRLAAATAAVGVSSAGFAAAAAPSTPRPLFRFGLIADVQYADIEDASNFAGTSHRTYRATLETVRLAVKRWNEQSDPAPCFVAQLGDLIDGQNAGKYGQGLSFADAPRSASSCDRVLNALGAVAAPIYHAVGNHELYNFSWDELRSRLNGAGVRGKHVGTDDSAARHFHFAFRPVEGWLFIMLNPYEVSMMGEEGSAARAQARALMEQRNPNSIATGQGAVNYFEGLVGADQRYVPFNGGVGDEQLEWLVEELRTARSRRERVVVMTHLPLDHNAASHRTTAWNCDDVLDVLHSEGRGNVVAVLAGHHHRGGYALDEFGVHHVTVHSPLENGVGCFGTVDVHSDRIELVGSGDLPSRSLVLPPLPRDAPVGGRQRWTAAAAAAATKL